MRLYHISCYQRLLPRYSSSSRTICQCTGNRRNAALTRQDESWPKLKFIKTIPFICDNITDNIAIVNTNNLQQSKNFHTSILQCMAGHSHWANIKFKKMHKDAERSKKFGKLSLEIISAVKGKYKSNYSV